MSIHWNFVLWCWRQTKFQNRWHFRRYNPALCVWVWILPGKRDNWFCHQVGRNELRLRFSGWCGYGEVGFVIIILGSRLTDDRIRCYLYAIAFRTFRCVNDKIVLMTSLAKWWEGVEISRGFLCGKEDMKIAVRLTISTGLLAYCDTMWNCRKARNEVE